MEQYNNAFFSYHLRPKQAGDVAPDHSQITTNLPKTAVVMQGPIMIEENFTLETIKLYLKTFPESIIILSTWEGQPVDEIKNIKDERLLIIESLPPENAGPFNINLQITSSIKGILRAKQIESEYVYKTRTDQRMYSFNITPYFIKLIQSHPLKENRSLNGRLVSVNFTTLKYRPYGIGDMLMFGHIDDMMKYWDSPLDSRDKDYPSKLKSYTMKDYALKKFAETYLCVSFLERIGHNILFTLEDSWNVYSNYFLLIDHQDIDLYWPKYEKFKENRFEYYYPHTFQLMTQKDWSLLSDLNLNENYINYLEGERIY